MIIYSEGMPSAPGVYACRVIRQRGGEIASDFFLFWNDVERKWHYLQQNRQFRGQVIVWLGPLPRVQLKHAKALAEYRRLQGSLDSRLRDMTFFDDELYTGVPAELSDADDADEMDEPDLDSVAESRLRDTPESVGCLSHESTADRETKPTKKPIPPRRRNKS